MGHQVVDVFGSMAGRSDERVTYGGRVLEQGVNRLDMPQRESTQLLLDLTHSPLLAKFESSQCVANGSPKLGNHIPDGFLALGCPVP